MENFTNSIKEKLRNEFRKYEKTFTANSPSVNFDESGEKISLKEIYNKHHVLGHQVVMIAVTRNQYDLEKFSAYFDYVKNILKKNHIYYGLWTDRKTVDNGKVEYDVLYVITSKNLDEIQHHLNLHDSMNDGVHQKMGLILLNEGSSKIQMNQKIS